MLTRGVFGIAFLLGLSALQAQAQTQIQTVLDGVYSDAQAARGQASYAGACGPCHGASLEGVSAPSLTGERFLDRWREGMLDEFHAFVKERMPPARDRIARAIPEAAYLDILTYILKVNGYRSGPSELPLEQLSEVMLVGKNGPQPAPDGALIMTVGCLSEAGNTSWNLSSAIEPWRTRTSTTSTPAELKASSARSLGTLSFRLVDLEAVPAFAPEPNKGRKIQVKGYLIRQPKAERISVSSIEILDSTCER